MSATHQNVYAGRDVRIVDGYLRWVVDSLEGLLPEPLISPTCKRKGHDWSGATTPISIAEVRACKRCARRGLLVLETRQVSNQERDPASRPSE